MTPVVTVAQRHVERFAQLQDHVAAGIGPPGLQHADMKALRFKAVEGVSRVAFAFDPER
jgi:hypothetical protein